MSQTSSDSGQPTGAFKDVHRLKTDGTASVEELREFLGQLKNAGCFSNDGGWGKNSFAAT
jgi:hypothetical protein